MSMATRMGMMGMMFAGMLGAQQKVNRGRMSANTSGHCMSHRAWRKRKARLKMAKASRRRNRQNG